MSRVIDLRGFSKNRVMPDHKNRAYHKYIEQLTSVDVGEDIQQKFAAIKEAFGFKRTEILSSAEGSSGVVHTPLFDYEIRAGLEDKDPATVLWQRRLEAIKDGSLLGSVPYKKVFGSLFDTLVLEFKKRININTIIDIFEDLAMPAVKVIYASDPNCCEIVIAGCQGCIKIEPSSVQIQGRRLTPGATMLDHFLTYLS